MEERHRSEDRSEPIWWEMQAHLEACRHREWETREEEHERRHELVAKAMTNDEDYNAELGSKGKWSCSTQ